MFDFHLHIARFATPEATAQELFQAKIDFNAIACEPWEWDRILLFMKTGPKVHYAFGIHPMVATKTTEEDFNRLGKILQDHQDVDVGECGLDKRFEGNEPAGIQEQVFKRQVLMALNLNRPLQVHCVGDYSRILKVLQDCTSDAESPRHVRPVILHRFGGDISVVKSALKLLGPQAMFSLHADSFRKKSTVAAIAEIPPEQIRFETDADDESWTANKIAAKLQEVQLQYGEIARHKR